MEKTEAITSTQEATYSIGNGTFNVSRLFNRNVPLNKIIEETITSENSKSHN